MGGLCDGVGQTCFTTSKVTVFFQQTKQTLLRNRFEVHLNVYKLCYILQFARYGFVV